MDRLEIRDPQAPRPAMVAETHVMAARSTRQRLQRCQSELDTAIEQSRVAAALFARLPSETLRLRLQDAQWLLAAAANEVFEALNAWVAEPQALRLPSRARH
jgi:hypothetical protein